ncbi:MAG: methylamine utilization protein MauJ [Clostridiaceae bacterium]
MSRRKVWEVDIDIIGPISISNDIIFKQEKGFDQDQFYSNITLKNGIGGITSTVTAYADNSEIARTVANVFFGRMVDILIIDNDIPLTLRNRENGSRYVDKASTRRTLEKEEFIAAFNVARRLEIEHPMLLKAIGWYSKGKVSINTLDSFLAYWNAIEITAIKYHEPTAQAQKGTINMVYQCFLDYFGEEANWDVHNRWINDMHSKRSRIAHGAEETTVKAINDVSEMIPTLEAVSRKLIYKVVGSLYDQNIFEQETWRAYF